MKQKELIYRELLFQAIEQKKYTFTQLDLAKRFNLSLSVVNYALKPLQQMGAIVIKPRSFDIVDALKILYFWASLRNVEKNIVYKTRIDAPVRTIESELPANIIFCAYSAYKFKFKDVPADYSEVYVYGDVEEIKKRFPISSEKLPPNLFVLEKDEFMKNYGKTTAMGQTFVDLWNIKEWYARDFLDALKKRIEKAIQNGNH
ncbi:winged helix-turn-helix domain-containing protein [Candidatus Woesearchaeota archaeon]|nr:winged helix-turn-helix domain-containing protein [Candidatus Woesearchaeota archaeon]